MKIAYLLGSLNRGGTETLLLDVFKNADKADFEFIGIHRKDGLLKDEFYETNVKLFKLFPRFPFDIVYLFKLRKRIKKENIDIIHVQQYIDVIYAWIACIGLKVKFIQTFHGFDNFSKKSKGIVFSTKITDKNIFVSDYQREYYSRKYNLKKGKQIVVYNGVSFEKIDAVDEKNIIPLFRSRDSKLLLGSVGNFVSVRDQMTICRFLKLLKQSVADFDFVFVGAKSKSESYLYDECLNYCREHDLMSQVHFLGSRNDISNILKQLDAFIYSTDHDTFGIAVVEAIGCGLPVFVNDWGVMTEITNDASYAILYKTKDENDLFRHFMLFLQEQKKYKNKALNVMPIVREKFSIKQHIINLTNVYQLL